MNGKFLLLIFVGFNIVSLLFSYGAIMSGSSTTVQENFFLNLFIDTSEIQQDITKLEDSSGIGLTGEFIDAQEGLTQQQASGTGTDAGFFNILDGLKIIFGLFVLLTPLPILSFFFSTGLPLFIIISLAVPMLLLWVLSIAEFLGNRKF